MDTAFQKGVRLMETLARSERPRGVSDLARELELTKSNVHRLLQTLSRLGYAHQDPDSELYRATIKFWELGFRVISRIEVRSFAIPYMHALAEATQEQVNLAVLDGDEIVYIDKIESRHPVHANLVIGHRAPAYGVAVGKAIVAYQTDEYLSRLMRTLKPFTGHTITRPEEFRKELNHVRALGYSVNRGEFRGGVAGVAAPILASKEYAVAAVGISGPSERFRPKDVLKFSKHVLRAARDISASLGYRKAANCAKA